MIMNFTFPLYFTSLFFHAFNQTLVAFFLQIYTLIFYTPFGTYMEIFMFFSTNRNISLNFTNTEF